MIERLEREGCGDDVRLTACPLCGHEFEGQEWRSKHFLNEHSSDDLGAPTPQGGAA